jgi:kelch-like protein 24/35
MYVLGGIRGGSSSASVLEFDSTQGTWIAVEPMPEPRHCHAACAIGCDIYVFGGHGGETSVFKFSTETNTWSRLVPMPLPCSSHSISVSVLDGDMVHILGAGHDSRGVLRFDTASGVWSTLGLLSETKRSSATFVLGGCLFVVGGQASSSSVERYDAATDTWTAVANMLEGQFNFRAVTIGSTDSVEEQDLFDSLIAKAAGNECKLDQVPLY